MTDQKVLITNYMVKGNGIRELGKTGTGNWKLVETGNWFIIL